MQRRGSGRRQRQACEWRRRWRRVGCPAHRRRWDRQWSGGRPCSPSGSGQAQQSLLTRRSTRRDDLTSGRRWRNRRQRWGRRWRRSNCHSHGLVSRRRGSGLLRQSIKDIKIGPAFFSHDAVILLNASDTYLGSSDIVRALTSFSCPRPRGQTSFEDNRGPWVILSGRLRYNLPRMKARNNRGGCHTFPASAGHWRARTASSIVR